MIVLQTGIDRIKIKLLDARSAAADGQHQPDMQNLRTTSLLLLALAFAPVAARAADAEATLVIKNHRFEPAQLKVPAGRRVKLSVHNQDNTPEEFESYSLDREKLVPAGAKATVFIGPLKPGRYEFYGEFHKATAQGVVVAE